MERLESPEPRETKTHPTSVALSRRPAAEVDAGTDIVLKIKVSCPYGCDLRGRVINVMAPDGAVVAGGGVADFSDNANETTGIALMAPGGGGGDSWSLGFPEKEGGGLFHHGRSL